MPKRRPRAAADTDLYTSDGVYFYECGPKNREMIYMRHGVEEKADLDEMWRKFDKYKHQENVPHARLWWWDDDAEPRVWKRH